MKSSKYNFIWFNSVKKEFILYNSFSGSLNIFPEFTGKIVKDILHNCFSRKDISSQMAIHNLVSFLYAKQYLIDDERNEYDELISDYTRNKFGEHDEKRWEVAVAPTMMCNFNCVYCYAALKSGCHMDAGVVEKLIFRMKEYIKAHSPTAVNISWIGGEPLCNLPAIRRISTEMYSFCRKEKCVFSASLITNGSLLTAKVAEELSYPPFQLRYIQITVDAYWHNESRPFREKKEISSLEATLNGLKNAALQMPGKVHVRVNIPCTRDLKPVEVARYIHKIQTDLDIREKASFYLAPVQPHTAEARINVSKQWSSRDFAKFKQSVNATLAQLNGMIYYPGVLLRHKMPCGYEYRDNVCIDPQGNIYKCWHHLGAPDKVIGHIHKKIDYTNFVDHDAYSAWKNMQPVRAKCKRCKVLPLCMGFCFDYVFEMGEENTGRCIHAKYTLKESCLQEIEAVLAKRYIIATRSLQEAT